MKKVILPLLIVILFIAGCSKLKQGVKDISGFKYSEKIIIGIDDNFPPLGFRNEQNEIVGFDIDLAKETARRMGVEVEFKPINWTLKLDELNSGNIDMIWNGLNISPERKKVMLFSKPYMDNRQILLVRKDSDLGIYSEYDLANKIVAVQAGSISEAYLAKNTELRNTLKDIVSCTSLEGAFVDLINGKFDVLIVDELAGRYEMFKNVDTLQVINVKIGDVTEIGIGFRKDNIELCNRVQAAFDEIIKDGTAKKISEEWFQADLIKAH